MCVGGGDGRAAGEPSRLWASLFLGGGSCLVKFLNYRGRAGVYFCTYRQAKYGNNPRVPRVVSKSDIDHGMATTATEPLGGILRVLFAVPTSP